MSGFVKLWRCLLQNELWKQQRVFSECEAWIHLLMIAEWKDEHRGTVQMTERQLAAEWGWNQPKVHRFLKRMTAAGAIELTKSRVNQDLNQKRIKIRIINWDKYQGFTLDGESRSESKMNQVLNHSPYYKEDLKKEEVRSPLTPLGGKRPKQTSLIGEGDLQLPNHLDTVTGREALASWFQHKREKGQTYKPTGVKTLITSLGKRFENAETFAAAVEHSIANNYTGIFPDKALNGRAGTATRKTGSDLLMEMYLKEKSMEGQ